MPEPLTVTHADGSTTTYPFPTPEEIEAGMRVATRKMVADQIAWAKKMERNQRGSKHRPGTTKTAKAKRTAESRKRNRAAGKSRRKNRKN